MAERPIFYDPSNDSFYMNGKRRIIRLIPECQKANNSPSIPQHEMPILAQTEIPVPGLMPATVDSNGEEKAPSNFEDIKETIAGILTATEHTETGEVKEKFGWIRQLANEVREHKKTAIFTIGLGAITVLAASAAGIEFGVRHGKDITRLDEIMQQHPHKK